jgi:hypothetical protein
MAVKVNLEVPADAVVELLIEIQGYSFEEGKK